ncbi:trypsin-like peptidase domain-containing protein [Oscillibacter sp.]|uniref:S1C family serine protease n=1 Tax=Oscillibacter sp. TaxID=1945593 RepID=UPI002602F2F3|nr:trypsin-like peptidase domain-containing protein [Oscillibacter sp.]MDD3347787.1 trypsin-like peptidase domain-containing protein [Oscillibacter sp.]
MKKRLFAVFCALCLLVSAVPAAAALEGESARAADILTTLGVLDEDASRDLTAPATRAQAAVLLVRLAGAEQAAKNDLWISGFRDVPAWAETAVTYAAHQNWVSGVTVTAFSPDAPITADGWCAFLLRMLGYSEKTGDFTVSGAAVFAQHIGLLSRTYSGALTQADLFQSAVDALSFSYRDGSATVAEHLVSQGVCTRSTANALGLLNETLTARQVADRHMAAVFALSSFATEREMLDNTSSSSASGFFISADGIAVTNYHTIDGNIHAVATLSTGETYPVESVLWYDAAMDLAVLRISKKSTNGISTSAFAHLDVAGTGDIRSGDTVYTLGNPLGLGLAVSSGIISATARNVDRYSQPCIMNTADISEGSSGGALLNVYGQVIAVTSGAYAYGNNMYLAVPVDPVMSADLTGPGTSLAAIVAAKQ